MAPKKKVKAKATKAAPKAKKATPAKKASSASLSVSKKARTKSEIMTAIAAATEITKKDVGAVLESLSSMIGLDISKGAGVFTIPGLMKVMVKKKPATKARKGVNPFTGEEMVIKAKPARNVVRIRPLKALKDLV